MGNVDEGVDERVDMVRCFLSRSEDEAGDVRYVPLEIFTLWRFLMERVHNLVVGDPVVAAWVPEQPAGGKGDPVVEVSFKYLEREGVGRPVTRYFPEDGFDEIFGYFRKHFVESNIMDGVRRRKGFFLATDVRPYEA
ncbi:hypothetical protein K8I61_01385 [bacterium]|nr:hypothetical protein [bacterium]